MPRLVARLIIKENKKLWETTLKKIFFETIKIIQGHYIGMETR